MRASAQADDGRAVVLLQEEIENIGEIREVDFPGPWKTSATWPSSLSRRASRRASANGSSMIQCLRVCQKLVKVVRVTPQVCTHIMEDFSECSKLQHRRS